MKLRDYQQAMHGATFAAFEAGHRRLLQTAATGLGKTVYMAYLAQTMLQYGRVMLIAHRDKLLTQAAGKLREVCGPGVGVGIECGAKHVHEDGIYKDKIVCASVQTLSRGGKDRTGRIKKFDPMEFSLLLVDEAHHDTKGNPSYYAVRQHMEQNPNLKVVGVSATPRRDDDQVLAHTYDFALPVYDIMFGIENGWLVNLRQRLEVITSINLDKVKVKAGELDGAGLARQLESSKPLLAMAKKCYEITNTPTQLRTVVFCATKAQAYGVCEALNRTRHDCACCIVENTTQEDRAEYYAAFRRGGYQYLVNVGVATEGFDEPGIHCVCLMRPTLSTGLYTQMIGRGTRTLEGVVDGLETAQARKDAIALSAKPSVLVLLFHGKNTKHKLITLANVLGEKYNDDVVSEVSEMTQGAAGSEKPVTELFEVAKAKLDEAARKKAAHDKKLHEESLAAEARRVAPDFTLRVETETYHVDPFDAGDVRVGGTHKPKLLPLSAQERSMLAGAKVPGWDRMPLDDQRKWLSEIKRRWAQGLLSLPQERALKNMGYPNCGSWSRARAATLLDLLVEERTPKY